MSNPQRDIPKSLIKTSRDEIDLPSLAIYKQENSTATPEPVEILPSDLGGYAFTVGALFQAQNRPQEDGTLLYTGDGMMYRLGFENGKASLKTRIAKTPCYYADRPTQYYLAESFRSVPKSKFATKDLKHRIFSYFAGFRDGGQSRFSIILGARNQLNTAFLRTRDHLLVTIDAGRPHIVDPITLELIEPTGETSDWKGIFPFVPKLQKNNLFDTYINSAHPLTDLSTINNDGPDEFYTTNYSTGYNGKYRKPVNQLFDHVLGPLFQKVLGKPEDPDDFGRYTYLIRYRFGEEKPLKRWRMLLPNGEPVLVEQSLHQLAITEEYIIMSDITFKMEFTQIFSPFFTGFLKFMIFKNLKIDWLGAWIYGVFLKQLRPLPYGALYIIKRADLEKNTTELVAQRAIIPTEISHFAADYTNPNHKITIHIGHNNGWDVTEGITRYDRPVAQFPYLRKDLEGMMTGTTDLGSLGRYVIDGEMGKILQYQRVSEEPATWSLSVYTHRELKRDNSQETAQTVKNIYWVSWGFSWELIPERIYNAYKNDLNRTVQSTDLPSDRRPTVLLRLNTETMTIEDQYHFPNNYFPCSPQFIPSSDPIPFGQDPSTHGYIVCLILKDNPENVEQPQDEFWIFHADDLNNKPIYRLRSPDPKQPLNIALTLHTTWIESLYSEGDEAERQQKREQALKRDYDHFLPDTWPIIQELAKDFVYPNFIKQTLEKDFEKDIISDQK